MKIPTYAVHVQARRQPLPPSIVSQVRCHTPHEDDEAETRHAKPKSMLDRGILLLFYVDHISLKMSLWVDKVSSIIVA